MIDLLPIDELREVRRRLAAEHGEDPHRYAAMLAEVARSLPGSYVAQPSVPPPAPTPPAAKAS